jgi:hypothetical protein
MPMPTENQEISNIELRKFGLLTSALLILFFVFLIPWVWSLTYPLWPWVVGAVMGAVALIAPAGLRPVYKVWMRFAEALGWLNTRIILSAVFYLIFVPFGLVMRVFNDPMRRKMNAGEGSYRVSSRSPKTENMEKPF